MEARAEVLEKIVFGKVAHAVPLAQRVSMLSAQTGTQWLDMHEDEDE